MHGNKHPSYRPEIDGLRAIAVLPVILFHAGISGFQGGFVGVDIFFVISGYLITNLLMIELRTTGTISIIDFYERRMRRLAPALVFMLVIVSALAAVILWPSQQIEYGANALASAAFISNVSLWQQGGYFGGPSETNALLHTWSLAVEEQFYIIFPPLLLFAWRLGRRLAILTTVAISLAASMLIAELGTVYAATANYYLLPSRAWELGIGALVAILWSQGGLVPVRLRDPLGLAGLAMIAWTVVTLDETTPFPGLRAVPPTLGTALILVSAAPGTWLSRILTLRVFVFFGLISYSLYLWHQPLLALYRVQAEPNVSATGIALVVVVSVLIAWVSWRYVERPFRARSFLSRTQLFAAGTVGFGVVAIVGAVFVTTQGRIERFPPHLHEMLGTSMSERGAYVRDAYTNEVRDRNFSGSLPRVLLIGDSFSQDFYNLIRESHAFAGTQISADYLAARCQFHIDGAVPKGAIDPGDMARCANRDNRITEDTIARARAADVVILAFYWRDWAAQQLPQTLAALDLQPETELYVIGSKEFAKLDVRQITGMSAEALRDFRAEPDATTKTVNALLAGLDIRATYVDLMALLCDSPYSCRLFTPSGALISHDGRHLTREGAKYLGDLLFRSDGPLGKFGPGNK